MIKVHLLSATASGVLRSQAAAFGGFQALSGEFQPIAKSA
jgi:hypothetical protein